LENQSLVRREGAIGGEKSVLGKTGSPGERTKAKIRREGFKKKATRPPGKGRRSKKKPTVWKLATSPI